MEIIFLALFCAGVLVPGYLLLPAKERTLVLMAIALMALVHISVLVVANSLYQFIPSETDTFIYYNLSLGNIRTIDDLISGALFVAGYNEGVYISEDWGGLYLKMLTISNLFLGESLILRKAISLPFYWLTLVSLFRIAREFLDVRGALVVLVLAGLLPTMWYPFTVLYRDTITTSLHILGLASFITIITSKERRKAAYIALGGSIIMLYFFRPAAVLLNLAALIPLFLGASLGRGKAIGGRVVAKVLGALTAVLIVYVLMYRGSIADDAKLGSAGAALEQSTLTVVRRWIETIHLFIVSEPHIISRKTDFTDIEQFRGIMNGVWVLLGPPFLISGSVNLLLSIRSTSPRFNPGSAEKPPMQYQTSSTMKVTVLWYLLLWSLALASLSDFTRWRLPAVPIMVLIAYLGWKRSSFEWRTTALVSWFVLLISWRYLSPS